VLVNVRFGSFMDGRLVTQVGNVPGVTATVEWQAGLTGRAAVGRTFGVTDLVMRTDFPVESGDYVMIVSDSGERFDVSLELDEPAPGADPMAGRTGRVGIIRIFAPPPVRFRLLSVRIQGYRPFSDFNADLGCLELLVGANGAGKSSLFEFLRLLRDGLRDEIPPQIVPGPIGQRIFHLPGPERFRWSLDFGTAAAPSERDGRGSIPWVRYEGELLGPVGRPEVSFERVTPLAPPNASPPPPETYMDVVQGSGQLRDEGGPARSLDRPAQRVVLSHPNQLALGTVTNPALLTLYMLREYISGWRFYSAYGIAAEGARRAVPVQQEPVLAEDGSNLSAVLHFLYTEHQPIFAELQQHLRAAVPGFRSLRVKARGGPGEVMAFWNEAGVEQELSLADLSDGTLRLLCWMVLCLQPNPPTMICIDEPDQGVHPRTLPILAGLFDRACERTQVLLATHSSYFLTQFELDQVAVLRKENGDAAFVKPSDSKTLTEMLADFGADELECIHRSDELERLA